jgi:predicted HTH domain antitoxin
MQKLTLELPESLVNELGPYRDNLDSLLLAGLRQVKLESALALFKQGDISLWKAARMAGVSLREMTQQAVAHGLRPTVDEETITEELEAWSS